MNEGSAAKEYQVPAQLAELEAQVSRAEKLAERVATRYENIARKIGQEVIESESGESLPDRVPLAGRIAGANSGLKKALDLIEAIVVRSEN